MSPARRRTRATAGTSPPSSGSSRARPPNSSFPRSAIGGRARAPARPGPRHPAAAAGQPTSIPPCPRSPRGSGPCPRTSTSAGPPEPPPGAGGAAGGLGAGARGAPLAPYPGVLLPNTAVPVGPGQRRWIPPLFAASAVSGAASLLDLLELNEREERLVWHFSVAGRAGELAAAAAVDREAATVERVARPLKEGLAGAMWRGAKACTAGSLLAQLVPFGSKR